MKTFAVLTTAVFAAVICAACSGGGNIPDEASGPQGTPFLVAKPGDLTPAHGVSAAPPDASPDYNFSWDLIAGQNTPVGTITVDLGNSDLKVTYNLMDGWTMSEAHLYANAMTPSPSGAPGQFPFKKTFNPGVSSYTFSVSNMALGASQDCGQVIYLATHASVKKGSRSETAWGGKWNNGHPSYEFHWSNKWGGYFSTVLLPSPALPAAPVWYYAGHYGSHSYWGVNFENSADHSFPAGSWAVTPAGNEWVAWCADKLHFMYANYSYRVTLLNSCSESLPAFEQNGNWDKINYLVTRRNGGSGIYNQDWSKPESKDAFEEAIWWFSNGITPGSALASQFVADADANGDNFVPHSGDSYVVILGPDTSTDDMKIRAQMNIVELHCD